MLAISSLKLGLNLRMNHCRRFSLHLNYASSDAFDYCDYLEKRQRDPMSLSPQIQHLYCL